MQNLRDINVSTQVACIWQMWRMALGCNSHIVFGLGGAHMHITRLRQMARAHHRHFHLGLNVNGRRKYRWQDFF